jgi:signal transduction histidine kinase
VPARAPATDRIEQSESNLARRLAVLDTVTSALSEATDLAGLLERTLDTALEITGVSGGGVFLFDEHTHDLRLVIHRGVSDHLAASYLENPGDTLRALATDPNAPLIVRELQGSSHRQELDSEGVRAYAGIPLQVRGRPIGVLVVVSYSHSDFNAADVELLTTIGRQIGFAIERARLYEESERSLRRAEVFQQMATAITASLDLEMTLRRALDAAIDVFEADRAALYLFDHDTGRTRCAASRNLSPEYIAAVESHEHGPELHAILDTRRTVYVEDAQTAHLTPALAGMVRREGFRSMLYLPLPNGRRRAGTFVFYHDRVRRYSDQEITLARTFADQVSIAVRHARLFEAERHAREQASTILEATRAVASSLRMDDVLVEAGRCVAAALQQRVCAIWLLNEDGTALVPAHRVAQSPNPALDELFRSLPPLPLSEVPRIRGLSQWRGAAVVRATDELSDLERTIQRIMPFHSYVAFPLAVRDRVVGGMVVPLSERSKPVDASDIDVGMAIARSTALAVENARLHEQSQQLAISEERNRLARELHDSVSHSLFSMTLISQALPILLDRDPDRARERIDRLNELGQGALAEMRALIFQLRPAALEEQGLVAALRHFLAAFESRERIAVDLAIHGERRLPAEVEETVFRIAQEAFNNVAKHARARRVTVELTIAEEDVQLSVQDDGDGFDPAVLPEGRRSLGMTSMRERATLHGGLCTVLSAPGSGTSVRLFIPLVG